MPGAFYPEVVRLGEKGGRGKERSSVFQSSAPRKASDKRKGT